ncbi:8020_t:CDS:1, partial [Scutellospora calospora]
FIRLDKIEWNELKQAINKAQLSILIPLPEDPSLITEQIQRLFPFELPITNYNNTKGIVMALRKIYSFL